LIVTKHATRCESKEYQANRYCENQYFKAENDGLQDIPKEHGKSE